MSADATQHQQVSPFSSLSMAIPPIEMPNVSKMSLRVKTTSQREPWPKVITLGAQPPSSSANAGTTQLESPKVQNHKVGGTGLQKSSSLNKRGRKTTEATPVTPKAAASESFETVRLKMRESLAAALQLVINDQNKPKDARQGDGKLSEDKSCVDKRPDRSEAGNTRSENGPPDHEYERHAEASMDSEAQKYDGEQEKSVECITSEGTSNFNCNNLQDPQQKGPSIDDGSSSESILLKDDFLRDNGLCWASSVGNEEIEEQEQHGSKRRKLSCDIVEEPNNEKPQALAKEIEEELFKLFGGVNKKYKEKGRSLLFNLKDRHNPELRQRVFSGEISPERLCSMTAEELASKELSQWRIAKAEELAQMVVLPELDVKYRMVKKTHKGEYQVEVEHDDSSSVEVAVGTSLLPQLPAKSSSNESKHPKASQKDSETPSDVSKSSSKKSSSNNKRDSEEHHPVYGMDSVQPENTDLMQYLMVEESKDAKSLPPVPSLDEFMMELDSEPPFVSMQDSAIQESCLSDEKSSDSLAKHSQDAINSPDMESYATTEKSEFKSEKRISPGIAGSKMDAAIDDFKRKTSEGSFDSNSTASVTKLHAISDNVRTSFDNKLSPVRDFSNGQFVWDGLIQLNISSLVTALGFHKSGEQVSTREWPSFLEIKGRVRLDAFEKFLQELRLSRSRAIMVLQFCWKDGSPESGRMKLCETIDSYIVDERVGFAEPMPGLELYFCPPHPKTTGVLIGNLAKEHEEAISKVNEGLVGVLVWKKEVSPKPPPSHPRKHSRKHSLARNNKDNPNANFTRNHRAAPPPPAEDDEEIDDVPPGFGPAAVVARDDDDLPEFSFAQGSLKTASSNFVSPNTPTPHPRIAPSSHPVEHLREMIQKYGSNENKGSWKDDDDDDDIPEWRPDLPTNPTHQRTPFQHLQGLQPNRRPLQMADQLPVPHHRPMYTKTPSQLPQHNQFAPRPWSGGAVGRHGDGRPTEPRYPGLPGVGGYGQNQTGWNHTFPRSR